MKWNGHEGLALLSMNLGWNSYRKEFAPSARGSKFFPITVPSYLNQSSPDLLELWSLALWEHTVDSGM